MRETEVPVTFQSPEKTVYVLRGTKLLEAAAVADLVLELALRRRRPLRQVPRGGGRRRGGEPTAAETAVLLRRGTALGLPAGLPAAPSRAP